MSSPGYQKVDDAEIRAKFEADWGVTLPTKKGLDNHEMIEAIQEGKLKALYIKGEDTITSDCERDDVGEALAEAGVPGRAGHQLLGDLRRMRTWCCRPAPSLEKDGTFTNTERRIQRLYKALEPLGESKPDWEIIQLIANKLGGAGAGTTSIRPR